MNDTFGPLGEAHSSSSKLCVYLLGPPRLEYEGRAWPVARLQVRALLYYLATQERPVARERLAAYFWPESSDRRAHRNLSHLLTHLRRELPSADLVAADNGLISLDSNMTWCDAALFRTLLATYHTDDRLQALQRAVSLYGGSYLDGFDTADCGELEAEFEQERIYLERGYLRALRYLMQHESAFGNYEAALAHARAYLDVDPLNEQIHGLVMRLYALTGERAQALRQFETCAETLSRELNAKPGSELLATREEIQAGRVEQWVLPGDRKDREPPRANGTFVGRHVELALLDDAMQRAIAGTGQVVLFCGESGIGKTRLLQECARRFADSAQVVPVECHAGTQNVPYYLAGRLLRSLLRERPAAQSDLLVDASWLVVELAQEVGLGQDGHFEHSLRKAKLIDSLSLLVVSLANQARPLVVAIDDLQWADAASLSWLNYLATHVGRARILFVGAFCCRATGQTAEFVRLLVEEGIHPKQVQLDGLNTVEIRQLVRAVSDQGADFATCAYLRALTGGNAFYLLSLLEHFQEQDQPFNKILQNGVDVPTDVAAAIDVRYQRLSHEAQMLLDLGALLPETFTFAELQAIAGQRPGELMLALEELAQRHLICEAVDGFRLSHQLIRYACCNRMNKARRGMLEALLQRARAAGVIRETGGCRRGANAPASSARPL